MSRRTPNLKELRKTAQNLESKFNNSTGSINKSASLLSTTDHLATVAEEIEQVDLEIAAEQETLEDEEVNSSGSDLQFSDSENHMRFNSTDNSKLDSMISPFKSSRAHHNRHNSTDNSKLDSMISPFKSSRARPYDDSDMSSLNYSQNSARNA